MATKSGGVPLGPRRPPNGVTEIKPGFHMKPHLITPVVVICLICICAITGVALWKILQGNDETYYPYGLATACLLGDFLLLGVFFGKNGKAGSMSISG